MTPEEYYNRKRKASYQIAFYSLIGCLVLLIYLVITNQ